MLMPMFMLMLAALPHDSSALLTRPLARLTRPSNAIMLMPMSLLAPLPPIWRAAHC